MRPFRALADLLLLLAPLALAFLAGWAALEARRAAVEAVGVIEATYGRDEQ